MPDGKKEIIGNKSEIIKRNGKNLSLFEIKNVFLENDAVSRITVVRTIINQIPQVLVFLKGITENDALNYIRNRFSNELKPDRIIILDDFKLNGFGQINFENLFETFAEKQKNKTETSMINNNNEDRKRSILEKRAALLERKKKLSTAKKILIQEKLSSANQENSFQESNAQLFSKTEERKTVIQKSPKKDFYPLSFSQERLWFLQQLAPENSAYNMPFALQIEGPLNIEILEKALYDVVERHEILRTHLALKDGIPKQVSCGQF